MGNLSQRIILLNRNTRQGGEESMNYHVDPEPAIRIKEVIKAEAQWGSKGFLNQSLTLEPTSSGRVEGNGYSEEIIQKFRYVDIS